MTGGRTLVTGATGFIGRAVVRRLLASGVPVTALGRARGEASAEARVRAATGAARDGDLEVVAGDLREPGAGLAIDDRRRLQRTVEDVIHCAGDTDFFPEQPAVARHPAAAGGVFHLVAAEAPRQEVVLAAITGQLGVRGFRLVTGPDALGPRPTPHERQVRALLTRYRDYLLDDVRCDDTQARRILARCGISAPALGAAAVRRLVGQALRAAPDRSLACAGAP